MPTQLSAPPSPFFQVTAATFAHDLATKKPTRPLAITFAQLMGVQEEVFNWLANEAPKGEQANTVFASHPMVANALGRGTATVKNAIQRLIKKGLVKRLAFENGRCGWTLYELAVNPGPRGGRAAEAPEVSKPRATLTLVSESYVFNHNKQTATSEQAKTPRALRAIELAHCQRVAQRLALADFRVSANDLLHAWNKRAANVFESLDEFLLSVEHIAFYLRSPESNGINHPRAWMMAQLKRGVYAEPVGFESMEAKHERLRYEELAEQAEAQKCARREAAELIAKQKAEAEAQEAHHRQARIQARVAQLSEAERRRLLRNVPVSNVFSQMAEAILRDCFNEREETCERLAA